MGVDNDKRRGTNGAPGRGSTERDYRSTQQARNAREARNERAVNSTMRARDAANQYAQMREKEKAMAKAKKVAALQEKKQKVKDFATKPMSERVSDSLFKAIDKTQMEQQYGIVDENESRFKRSFRESFVKHASKRVYKGNKLKTDLANGDRIRSDGRTVPNAEYVQAVKQLPEPDKKQEVSSIMAKIRERMIALQNLVIEKGYYTGPSVSTEATYGR